MKRSKAKLTKKEYRQMLIIEQAVEKLVRLGWNYRGSLPGPEEKVVVITSPPYSASYMSHINDGRCSAVFDCRGDKFSSANILAWKYPEHWRNQQSDPSDAFDSTEAKRAYEAAIEHEASETSAMDDNRRAAIQTYVAELESAVATLEARNDEWEIKTAQLEAWAMKHRRGGL